MSHNDFSWHLVLILLVFFIHIMRFLFYSVLLYSVFFFSFFTCLLIFKEKGKEDVKLDEWGVGDDLGGDEEGTIVIRIHCMKKTN